MSCSCLMEQILFCLWIFQKYIHYCPSNTTTFLYFAAAAAAACFGRFDHHHAYLLTYLFTYLLHGAESFLGN
jgi:hypothetical protein